MKLRRSLGCVVVVSFGATVLVSSPLVIAPAVVRAAGPLIVTTTIDAPDTDVTDGDCKSTAGDACTLRAAIQTANATPGLEQITISDSLTTPQPSPTVCQGPTFDLTVDSATPDDDAATGDLDITDPSSVSSVGQSSCSEPRVI